MEKGVVVTLTDAGLGHQLCEGYDDDDCDLARQR